MAQARACALIVAAALLAAGCSAATVPICEPSSEGCYPSKAYLTTLNPTVGAGKAPPKMLAMWGRQALCAAAVSEGACMASDSASKCYWDDEQEVCFSTLKAAEAVACPGSWVADYVACDPLGATACKANARCMWGALGEETLCYAKAAVAGGFDNWGAYQLATFTDPVKLGTCATAEEYKKLQGQCWSRRDPQTCESADGICLWNPFAKCNLRARVSAAFVTGNHRTTAAAYALCNAKKDPKECSATGTAQFTARNAQPVIALGR
ncbi:MAG: hypothetical protein J3K34DRAFT_219986 [Monoraphidium minutum]|nr:MAG: hypothetical protein J3K34DRAFT_219986 [Monoraphidium minutum]